MSFHRTLRREVSILGSAAKPVEKDAEDRQHSDSANQVRNFQYPVLNP